HLTTSPPHHRGDTEETPMQPPTYADIVAAAPVVQRHLRPTPLYEWPALSQLLGCRYFLKHENHTPATAFKVRGGIYLVARLPEEQKRRGIIACTTGNHGQSLAYACRLFGVRCVIVVPAVNNPDKIAAIRVLGAELIEHGRDYDEAREHCEVVGRRQGLRYVHSANEPDLIAGVGTYALEIFDALPEPDVILVPVGLAGPRHLRPRAGGRRPPAADPGHRRAVGTGPFRDAVLAGRPPRADGHAGHLRGGHGDTPAGRHDAGADAAAGSRHGPGRRR